MSEVDGQELAVIVRSPEPKNRKELKGAQWEAQVNIGIAEPVEGEQQLGLVVKEEQENISSRPREVALPYSQWEETHKGSRVRERQDLGQEVAAGMLGLVGYKASARVVQKTEH